METRCEQCVKNHKKCSHPLWKRILVIPDTQVRPGVPTDHFTHIGNYIAAKQPDVIIHIGDHWDMESLCSYDKGTKSFEGRRYKKDIEAGNKAMELLLDPWYGLDGYKPEMHFLMGNHEERILRALQVQPELEGVIGYEDFSLEEWQVHPYLEIIEVEGVKFSHYFTSGLYGRPVSSAAVLLREAQGSAVMGHVQKVDIEVHPKTGTIALFAGVCYQHDEEYLGPQGNSCRRQVVMLNECRDGLFDPMFVSLNFLRRRYGQKA